MINEKALELQEKIHSRKSITMNNAINWYATGENFISWDIRPIKSKEFNQKYIDMIDYISIDISKSVNFYCCPDLMSFNGFVRLTFWF